MRLRTILLLALYTFAALLAACAPQGAESKPPEIIYGQDMCDECGMLIDDPKFAAALILDNGDTRKFDDLGEMFAYVEGHPDETVRTWFVHDYHTEAWVNAEAAYFVMTQNVGSPMGHGIAAFELQDDAEAFAQDSGSAVLTFAEVLAHPPAVPEMGTH